MKTPEFPDPISKRLAMTRVLLAVATFSVLFAQPNGFFLYFPKYPVFVAALIAALGLLSLAQWKISGRLYLPRANIFMPLSLFFIWSAISLLYAPDWQFGLRLLLSMLTKVMIFGFIIELYDRYRHLRLPLLIIAITGSIFSFQAIAQFIGIGLFGIQPLGRFNDAAFWGDIIKNIGIDDYGLLGMARSYFLIGSHRFPRAHGIFLEPGWFANFLEFTIFTTLALFAVKRDTRPSLVSILLIPQIVALFLTFSPAGWLAAGMGGFVYVRLGYQKTTILKLLRFLPLLFLLVISASLLAPRTSSSIFKLMWTEKFNTPWGGASLPTRLTSYEKSLTLIRQSPLLGLGTSQTRIAAGGTGANNSLLTVFVELGLIGGIIYLWVIGAIIKTILSNWRKSRSLGQPHLLKMTAAITAGFTALFAHSLLLDTNWTFFYWIGIALIYVDSRILDRAAESCALRSY